MIRYSKIAKHPRVFLRLFDMGLEGMELEKFEIIIKKLEPLMAGLVAIEKNRELSYEEAAQLIDVTEQIIEKPIKKQREYFSGKKRKYTFKTEIRVNSFGQIRNVSKSYKGRDHDFKIHKAGDPLPIGT
ncbi:transposase family protein, partial [Candidatus Sarmatiella mevalonica]|uniref:transposase family protein n=1 Tax=Candidatus Sarmatiella mevalonica TaxID=2770581 RepID=UPI00313356AA